MSGADFIECPTVIGALFDTNSQAVSRVTTGSVFSD